MPSQTINKTKTKKNREISKHKPLINLTIQGMLSKRSIDGPCILWQRGSFLHKINTAFEWIQPKIQLKWKQYTSSEVQSRTLPVNIWYQVELNKPFLWDAFGVLCEQDRSHDWLIRYPFSNLLLQFQTRERMNIINTAVLLFLTHTH